jgi:predicted RecB family nuclease
MTTKRRNPFKLSAFRGVEPEHVEKLAAAGIKTTEQMLAAGRTAEKRAALAQDTGIPAEAILELVKLSDLARLPGVKGIRARLYYDAGVDCVEKLAAWEPEALLRMTAEFVERPGFDGIAPLPKEISSTIANAKRLPRVVEY